jgi:NitT/TauT family transport system substrate-binding protein
VRLTRIIACCLGVWLGVITLVHGTLNLRWFAPKLTDNPDAFRVGFLPVTCHLTCPVTDFIQRNSVGGESTFQPIKFSGWPELKEAFLSGYLPVAFILAPMAMALREDGVPVKIVYLGHRDGTAMVVHKDSDILRIEDLRGKRVAVPNRFSNQRLLLFKALRERGIGFDEVELLELAPPDMPAALYARAVDAITSGEPFMGQAELDGYGRVLYLTKDVWPGFISCVLAVHDDVIAKQRDQVQALVDGIARSGRWLDAGLDHRWQAGGFVAEHYYNQDPRLLRFVLSKPPDRVRYTDLTVVRSEFEAIERLGLESGILRGTAHFPDYADPSFSREASQITPWDWEPK